MNYATLVTTIESFAEDYDAAFVAQIPQFVKNAEAKIYTSVQLPNLRRNVTGTLTANNKYLTLPTDFLAVYSMAVIDGTGSYTYLLNKDVNYIREAFPAPGSTGIPQVYALFDNNTAILGPTPDSGYAVELHEYYFPTSIVTAGTTWLGDNYESVLLYGALCEAAAFMKSETDTVQLYTKQFTEALSLLKRVADGMERRDAYRSGQARVNVV